MATITTHVLDTARGKPAAGVTVTLEALEHEGSRVIARGATDDDGRCKTLTAGEGVPAGAYRLAFDTGAYFARQGTETFFPRALIEFAVRDAGAHFHVPLLVAPFGYSTYRGS